MPYVVPTGNSTFVFVVTTAGVCLELLPLCGAAFVYHVSCTWVCYCILVQSFLFQYEG